MAVSLPGARWRSCLWCLWWLVCNPSALALPRATLSLGYGKRNIIGSERSKWSARRSKTKGFLYRATTVGFLIK